MWKRCECKKHHICEKEYTWNPTICSCENGEYLANPIDDSVILSDEIIGEKKFIPTKFNEKRQLVKSKISIFYVHFY